MSSHGVSLNLLHGGKEDVGTFGSYPWICKAKSLFGGLCLGLFPMPVLCTDRGLLMGAAPVVNPVQKQCAPFLVLPHCKRVVASTTHSYSECYRALIRGSINSHLGDAHGWPWRISGSSHIFASGFTGWFGLQETMLCILGSTYTLLSYPGHY